MVKARGVPESNDTVCVVEFWGVVMEVQNKIDVAAIDALIFIVYVSAVGVNFDTVYPELSGCRFDTSDAFVLGSFNFWPKFDDSKSADGTFRQ
jgi:hypothetical protein